MGDVAATVMNSEATRTQGKYQQFAANMNARFLEKEAEGVIKQGDKDAIEYGKQVKSILASQTASYAAAGLDVSDYDSSLGDLQRDTERLGKIDQLTIKKNAWEQAWGIRADAMQMKFSGQMQRQFSQVEANRGLAVAGLQGAEKAVTYGMGGGKQSKGGGGGTTYSFKSTPVETSSAYRNYQSARTA